MKNILGKVFIILFVFLGLNAQDLFILKVAKNKAYINEAIPLTLTLKYSASDPILKKDFEELLAKSFWIKELDESEPYRKGESTYIDFNYLVSAQSVGGIVIDEQVISIARREAKTNLIQWKQIYSNQVKIEVLALPKGITIQGNYNIELSIDKTKVEANTPINLTLKLSGSGNINDIEPFKLNMKEQLVFSDTPIIDENTFTQKFSILSEESFTLKAIVFEYFNIDTKLTEKIKTKPIKIEVESNKKDKLVVPKDSKLKYIYALLGFIFGVVVFYTIYYFKNRSVKVISTLEKKIQKAKSDKELYQVLLPYSIDNNFDGVMKALEENIYHNEKNKIDKKRILKKF